MDDALSRLLDEVRPRGAVFDRSSLDPSSVDAALRFPAGASLALATVLSGEAVLTPDGGEPHRLGAGDVAIVVGSVPCTIGAGVHGAAPGASLLTGTYEVRGSVCDRILRGLPPVLVVEAATMPYPVVQIVTAELARARPGQRAVLDRLLDLLLVTALREWLDRPGSGAPAWYHAQEDRVVGTALRLLHGDPAHPWTVAELAARASVSRSAFARRFTELVGEPPMSYLACWRLCLAADLLVGTDDTLEAIARRVGYSGAYALSVAFTRVHGVRPGEHRARARARAA